MGWGGGPGEILFVPIQFLSSQRDIMQPIFCAKAKNIIVGGDEEGYMPILPSG